MHTHDGRKASWKPTDVNTLTSLRMLTTGGSDETTGDVLYMVEEMTWQYFKCFCKDIVDRYKTTYLTRWVTGEELDEIQWLYHDNGLYWMSRCFKLFKAVLKNCPTQDKYQYLNTKESTKLACIQCETWCEADLYCWHCQFQWNVGRSHTNNSINVLKRSRLFKDILFGRFLFRLQDL